MFKIIKLKIFLILFFLTLAACSKTDPVTGEKILIEPNPNIKARETANKGDGILGNLGKNTNKSTSAAIDFVNSNVLWKATLKTLDFIPLSNTDYTGGVINYDWYSEKENEQIKITVRFLSNELRSESIQIISHKKTCLNFNNCSTQRMNENFSNQIKETILASARNMKIEEAKKERK
jgi:hypothetical protein